MSNPINLTPILLANNFINRDGDDLPEKFIWHDPFTKRPISIKEELIPATNTLKQDYFAIKYVDLSIAEAFQATDWSTRLYQVYAAKEIYRMDTLPQFCYTAADATFNHLQNTKAVDALTITEGYGNFLYRVGDTQVIIDDSTGLNDIVNLHHRLREITPDDNSGLYIVKERLMTLSAYLNMVELYSSLTVSDGKYKEHTSFGQNPLIKAVMIDYLARSKTKEWKDMVKKVNGGSTIKSHTEDVLGVVAHPELNNGVPVVPVIKLKYLFYIPFSSYKDKEVVKINYFNITLFPRNTMDRNSFYIEKYLQNGESQLEEIFKEIIADQSKKGTGVNVRYYNRDYVPLYQRVGEQIARIDAIVDGTHPDGTIILEFYGTSIDIGGDTYSVRSKMNSHQVVLDINQTKELSLYGVFNDLAMANMYQTEAHVKEQSHASSKAKAEATMETVKQETENLHKEKTLESLKYISALVGGVSALVIAALKVVDIMGKKRSFAANSNLSQLISLKGVLVGLLGCGALYIGSKLKGSIEKCINKLNIFIGKLKGLTPKGEFTNKSRRISNHGWHLQKSLLTGGKSEP